MKRMIPLFSLVALSTSVVLADDATIIQPDGTVVVEGAPALTINANDTDELVIKRSSDKVTLLDLSFLFWSIPGASYDVQGLRINAGTAENRAMLGLDIGLFSLTKDYSAALQINVLGNVVRHDANGVQIGLFNRGKSMSGIQIGLINSTDDLTGLQIGLINVSQHAILPIINVGW